MWTFHVDETNRSSVLILSMTHETHDEMQNLCLDQDCSFPQVTNYLFPIWTYSYLAFLVPVFLLTDLLRHKPLIVVQGFFLVTNYVLLCFAPGLPAMVVLQVH